MAPTMAGGGGGCERLIIFPRLGVHGSIEMPRTVNECKRLIFIPQSCV